MEEGGSERGEKHIIVHWPHPLTLLQPRETKDYGTRTDWGSAAAFMLD